MKLIIHNRLRKQKQNKICWKNQPNPHNNSTTTRWKQFWSRKIPNKWNHHSNKNTLLFLTILRMMRGSATNKYLSSSLQDTDIKQTYSWTFRLLQITTSRFNRRTTWMKEVPCSMGPSLDPKNLIGKNGTM